MSNQKTGYVQSPGLGTLLSVREDGAALNVAGTVYTLPSSAATLARTDAANTFTGSQTVANLLTSTSVGTVTTAATTVAEEHGDGLSHVTKLTFTAFAVGTSDNGAALASGAKFYTLPAGAIVIDGCALVGSLTGAMTTKTDTPEVGIGTVIGSGVAATLSTTMEDIVDGGAAGLIGGASIAPDVNGTTFAKGMLTTSAQGVYIATSGGKSHDLFLNIADTWVAEAAAAVTFTGVITLKWRIVS